MGNPNERYKQIHNDLASRMKREPDEIQNFYRILSDPATNLSFELMARIAPEWKKFSPVEVNGNIIAYTRPGFDLTPSQSPQLIMPDSPSAGGKTVLVHELVNSCLDCARVLQTCTTRPLQVNEKISKKIVISKNPLVEAHVSPQYVHVSEEDFKKLIDAGFFTEYAAMWDTKTPHASKAWYGIPQTALDHVGEEGPTAFWFLVVNEAGQQATSTWMQKHKPYVGVQKWFLLPTNQTFKNLEERIMFLRTEQAAPRIIDALHDLWRGAGRTDVIFCNAFSKDGIPHEAVSHVKQFMKMMHPGVFQ